MIFSTQAIILSSPVHSVKVKGEGFVKLTEITPSLVASDNIQIDNIGIDRHLNTYIGSNEFVTDFDEKDVPLELRNDHTDSLTEKNESNRETQIKKGDENVNYLKLDLPYAKQNGSIESENILKSTLSKDMDVSGTLK